MRCASSVISNITDLATAFILMFDGAEEISSMTPAPNEMSHTLRLLVVKQMSTAGPQSVQGDLDILACQHLDGM